MKTKYLFPHSCKKIGWLIFIPTTIAAIIRLCVYWELDFLDANVFCMVRSGFQYSHKDYFTIIQNNITDEILMILLIVSGLLTAFSKEKNEDEMVEKIRMESLVWATYFNYTLLLVSIIFLFGDAFFTALLINITSLLIFFIFRFDWVLYRTNKITTDEE